MTSLKLKQTNAFAFYAVLLLAGCAIELQIGLPLVIFIDNCTHPFSTFLVHHTMSTFSTPNLFLRTNRVGRSTVYSSAKVREMDYLRRDNLL